MSRHQRFLTDVFVSLPPEDSNLPHLPPPQPPPPPLQPSHFQVLPGETPAAAPFGDNTVPASCIPADSAGACSWRNKTLCFLSFVLFLRQLPGRWEDSCSAAHCVSTHLCSGSCDAASLSGSRYLETGCFSRGVERFEAAGRGPLLPKALIRTRAAAGSVSPA